MKQPNLIVCLTTVAALMPLGMTACQSTPKEPQRRTVTAADFAGPAPSTTPPPASTDTPLSTPAQTEVAVTSPAAPASNTPPAQATNPDAPPATLTMDAMVGQVNGRAIYASTVFEPINAQLAALGRTLPPSIFRQRATELIVGQLQTLVTNALILGEAERDLTRQEQYGLLEMLKSRRSELLRQFGGGSVALADKNSLESTGKNIDEQVNEFRDQVLIGRYVNNKVRPRINVSRKDIERYYDTHRAQFNPPAGRTIRLIMTSDPGNAEHISKLLASGKSFDEVASQSINQYRASNGGMWPNRIEGDKFSNIAPLNEAMLKLQAGEHSARIEADKRFWWVKLESYESGKGRTLDEVQLEIRNLLETQQRDALGLEFRHKLLTEGSYNPIDQMTTRLVDIAMSRYSQPIQQSSR